MICRTFDAVNRLGKRHFVGDDGEEEDDDDDDEEEEEEEEEDGGERKYSSWTPLACLLMENSRGDLRSNRIHF